MKKLIIALLLIGCMVIPVWAEEKAGPENLLDGAPYAEEGMGKRKLVDEDHLLLMQIALKPGQSVPKHNANANVHIIVLEGAVVINLSGKDVAAKKGDLVPVAFKTPMIISNTSEENATFVVIKTPSPGQMGK